MFNNVNNIESYLGMNLPISSANIAGTGYMLAERAKFTARNTRAVISTGTSAIDGTGSTLLVAGAAPGCIVKRIIIKAEGTTQQGMIRFFHYIPTTYRLYYEVEVPAITQSMQDQTLIKIINEPFYLVGSSSYKIYVTTQLSNTFIITTECLDFTNP